jgi:hypothetical protein
MTDQQALWQQVKAIKRRAPEIGEKPPHEVRSTPAIKAYQENEPDKKLVQRLQESAEKL